MKKVLNDYVINIQFFTTGLVLLMLCFGIRLYGQISEKTLYLDPLQPVEKRVLDLISRVSVEEKAILLNHVAPDLVRQLPWKFPGINYRSMMKRRISSLLSRGYLKR